jgi:hypothetical protein
VNYFAKACSYKKRREKMNPKIKYTLAGLSAVFALVATPPLAIFVESGLNLDRMTTEMDQKFKARKKEVDAELEFDISTTIAKNNACLEKEAFPYLAIAETFESWGGRLSFYPRLSRSFKGAKNDLELQGFVKAMKCLAL